jgi:hypothetical protein
MASGLVVGLWPELSMATKQGMGEPRSHHFRPALDLGFLMLTIVVHEVIMAPEV